MTLRRRPLLFALLLATSPLAESASQSTTYTCPMHPAERGRRGDHCPICRMALVPSASGTPSLYALDVEMTPRAIRPHQRAQVRFLVREPKTGAVVRRFELVHERMFHLFIVDQDLDYFVHTHPTLRGDGILQVDLELPKAGAYQLIADFMPAGGSPQLIQKSLVTAGYAGRLALTPQLPADATEKSIESTRVGLTMPDAIAGREQLVTFDVKDAGGAPATDLEPYLGAAGHLLLVSADLAVASHSHPVAELSSTNGPTVVFQVVFPRTGDYRMWAQFQRRGRVVTAPFTVAVRGRS